MSALFVSSTKSSTPPPPTFPPPPPPAVKIYGKGAGSQLPVFSVKSTEIFTVYSKMDLIKF